MTSSGVQRKCKLPRCGENVSLIFDPCNEKSFYQCPFPKNSSSCASKTHFSQEFGCGHVDTISDKTTFWRECNISNNFSTEQCRAIWPKDYRKWNWTKINEFLSGNKSTLAASPQENTSFLVPFIIISLLMICVLVAIIILAKKYKRANLKIMKDNNILPEKQDEEDHIYEELNENEISSTAPALVDEIYDKMEISQISPNLKNLLEDRHSTQEVFIGTGNQEEVYSVIQQDLKSSGMLPERDGGMEGHHTPPLENQIKS